MIFRPKYISLITLILLMTRVMPCCCGETLGANSHGNTLAETPEKGCCHHHSSEQETPSQGECDGDCSLCHPVYLTSSITWNDLFSADLDSIIVSNAYFTDYVFESGSPSSRIVGHPNPEGVFPPGSLADRLFSLQI